MSKRLEEVARRKQILVERAAHQRAELSEISSRIRSPFEVGHTLIGISRALKAHPLIAAAASSIIVSGYATRLVKSTAELLRLWWLLIPVWAWWRSHRKTS